MSTVSSGLAVLVLPILGLRQAALPAGRDPWREQRGVADASYNAAVLRGVLSYPVMPGLASGCYRFGGTSAGSRQWAAITAYTPSFNDIASGTRCSGQSTRPNPVIAVGNTGSAGRNATTDTRSPVSTSLID
jgi:hypothetical protein